MYQVTSRFLPRIAESHVPVSTVQLWLTNGQVLDLDHTGGSVSVDAGADIRRTCTVTGCDTSLIPMTAADKLSTYGARLRIAVGVDYGDGTQELIPQGVFRLDDVGGDPTMGPVTLTGSAQEIWIQDDLFLAPYRATGTVVTAITALINRTQSGATILSRITDVAIGARTWDIGDNPWAAIQEIAAVAGATCYTNGDGAYVIAAMPDLLSAMPVWEVAAAEGGAYISAIRGMSSVGVKNGVLAMADNVESGAAPVSALVVDSDPGSPTYWSGPFGHRPVIYKSSTLTTTAACTAAAGLQLATGKAPNAKGNFSAVPNAALESWDVIRVIHPDGVRELHQVKSFTVPLDLGGDFPITTVSAKEDG